MADSGRMRQALLVLLVLPVFGLPTTASAAPEYPACPETVGSKKLTSTSQRGDEAYPQIVCWYEEGGAHEFHAGWATDTFPGDANIGCKPSDAPHNKFVSKTHEVYVGTNYDFVDMPPGFVEAAQQMLALLEQRYAKSCFEEGDTISKNTDFLKLVLFKKRYRPDTDSKPFCDRHVCRVEHDARFRICNKDAFVHHPFSLTTKNKFDWVLKPGQCKSGRFRNPRASGTYRVKLYDRIHSNERAVIVVGRRD